MPQDIGEIVKGVAPILQPIVTAGVIALVGLAWKGNERFKRIEMLLTDPDVGLVQSVRIVRERTHDHNGKLTAHAVRIDGIEDDLTRLDRDKANRSSVTHEYRGPADR